MKITKRQLRRIIREEKARLLNEDKYADEVGSSFNDDRPGHDAGGDHTWPRVDWNDVGDLTDKWVKMEEDAWDKADPSMNPDDESDADARRHWEDQVDAAGMDFEAELTLRVRRIALDTMKEFSDKLINGDYA